MSPRLCKEKQDRAFCTRCLRWFAYASNSTSTLFKHCRTFHPDVLEDQVRAQSSFASMSLAQTGNVMPLRVDSKRQDWARKKTTRAHQPPSAGEAAPPGRQHRYTQGQSLCDGFVAGVIRSASVLNAPGWKGSCEPWALRPHRQRAPRDADLAHPRHAPSGRGGRPGLPRVPRLRHPPPHAAQLAGPPCPHDGPVRAEHGGGASATPLHTARGRGSLAFGLCRCEPCWQRPQGWR
jgi:hypothetical protein